MNALYKTGRASFESDSRRWSSNCMNLRTPAVLVVWACVLNASCGPTGQTEHISSEDFERHKTAGDFLDRGNDELSAGRFDAAIQHFERALEFHPGWDTAHHNIAVAQARIERMNTFPGPQKVVIDSITRALSEDDLFTAQEMAYAISNETLRVQYVRLVKNRQQTQ